LCNQSTPECEGAGTAVDTLIQGLTEAHLKGQWSASEASEARRLALLPQCEALPWDDLMVHPDYMHALDWIA
jgi:beta-N-acetylhexosaminidase